MIKQYNELAVDRFKGRKYVNEKTDAECGHILHGSARTHSQPLVSQAEIEQAKKDIVSKYNEVTRRVGMNESWDLTQTICVELKRLEIEAAIFRIKLDEEHMKTAEKMRCYRLDLSSDLPKTSSALSDYGYEWDSYWQYRDFNVDAEQESLILIRMFRKRLAVSLIEDTIGDLDKGLCEKRKFLKEAFDKLKQGRFKYHSIYTNNAVDAECRYLMGSS